MKIYGKGSVNILHRKDLKTGDVFCYLKDCGDVQATDFFKNLRVYMCCLSDHETADLNMQTGIVYAPNDEDEPVCVLDVTLTIKEMSVIPNSHVRSRFGSDPVDGDVDLETKEWTD